MSPTPIKQEDHHRCHYNNVHANSRMTPSSLKIRRDSHMIKKPSSPPPLSVSVPPRPISSPGSSSGGSQNQQQRGPVIIYTHSPKVIHTNPNDFMALVQKLTGMSSNDKADPTTESNVGTTRGSTALRYEDCCPQAHQQNFVRVPGSTSKLSNDNIISNNNNTNNSSSNTDDNESSSVITDEHCSSGTTGDIVGQLHPLVGPTFYDSSMSNPPFINNYPDLMLGYGVDPPVYDDFDLNYIPF